MVPRYSQTYTFYTQSDDGVRLWVNGQLLRECVCVAGVEREPAGEIYLRRLWEAEDHGWAGNEPPTSAAWNRFMYTGREWIAELGIYDYRHRYYNPELGRFLQTDPIGLQTEGAKLSAAQKALFSPGGVAPEAFTTSEMNLYRYCGDDPVNKTDPMGLDDSAWRWINAPKIEIQKTGNWGERTENYYRTSVTCDGAAAEGCTTAKITDLKPLADGGLKAKIHVDVGVLETHKGGLVDDREQDHPNGFKKLLKDINTKVHVEMVQDKRSYNSLEEYAAGRARHLYRLFKEEKDAQERWDQKGGRHDYNNPEFREKQK